MPLRVINVQQGWTEKRGSQLVFHPIRSSSDYDATALSGAEGMRARRERTRRKAKKKKKAKAKRRNAGSGPVAQTQGYYLFHMRGHGYYWTNREGQHVTLPHTGGRKYFSRKDSAKKAMRVALSPKRNPDDAPPASSLRWGEGGHGGYRHGEYLIQPVSRSGSRGRKTVYFLSRPGYHSEHRTLDAAIGKARADWKRRNS